jgi:transcriptional regulator with XRE-family HTH domain
MRLKELREEAGLLQRELGDRLQKKVPGRVGSKNSQPRIQRYESGDNKMRLDVAQALVTILNKELAKKRSKMRATLQDLL